MSAGSPAQPRAPAQVPWPIAPSPEAEAFYAESLGELERLGLPFLVAGTYALAVHTGIQRPTKDLDILCTAGDFPRILGHFQEIGWEIEIEDERWIGKVRRGELFFDLIFGSGNGTLPVNPEWFTEACSAELLGHRVLIVSPTEMVWSKIFIQLRHRYDGPDIMHVILKAHDRIDWHRLLKNMEPYWELLLAHLINYRWIYPAERDHVPRWLMDELAGRLHEQLELPAPKLRICRGPMLSRFDYQVDMREWGYGVHDSSGA